MARSETLLAEWRARLDGVRADAAARRVIELLPEHPVVSAAVVGEQLGITARAGQTALATLAERGIVVRFHSDEAAGPGRPTQYWVADELIALVAGWPGT